MHSAAKTFAIVYALFSGAFFLTMVAVLLAPAVHYFLHVFHIELGDGAASRDDSLAAAIFDCAAMRNEGPRRLRK